MFSRVDIIDEIHETFNCLHSCFTLLRCELNENKRTIEALYTAQVSPFKILRSLNLEWRQSQERSHRLLSKSNFTQQSTRHHTPALAVLVHWVAIADTGSELRSFRIFLTGAETKVKSSRGPWPLDLRGAHCTSALQDFRLLSVQVCLAPGLEWKKWCRK